MWWEWNWSLSFWSTIFENERWQRREGLLIIFGYLINKMEMQNVSTPPAPLQQLVHEITPSINEKDDAWSKTKTLSKKRLTCDRINVYKQWRYLKLLLCSCKILPHELCDQQQCHKVSTIKRSTLLSQRILIGSLVRGLKTQLC